MKQEKINMFCMILIILAIALIITGLILELNKYLIVGGVTYGI